MRRISEITGVHRDGSCDYKVRIYLGKQAEGKIARVLIKSDEFFCRKWQVKEFDNNGFCEIHIRRIRPGTGLHFNIEFISGQIIDLVPLGESDVVNGIVRVPDYDPSWLNEIKINHHDSNSHHTKMGILLEHTLEGLLANYEDGIYFTDTIEELLEWSISERILETKIPDELSALGYTELMVPLYASVADRCNLNPKFNYLVYNLSPDWQLGTTRQLRKLVHRFRDLGIEIIPDLVFVHQVKDPFNGSADNVCTSSSYITPYIDQNPYLFRDYGTWYFNLEDPELRAIIIEKILETIILLDLRVVRVDYIDGLLMQYNGRPFNYAINFILELKESLDKNCPHVHVLGEAFQTANHEAVNKLVNSSYSPRGFQLLDLFLTPCQANSHMVRSSVEQFTEEIGRLNYQSNRESNYSQLHDECWSDSWICLGRPYTPWAYGKMPLGLCLDKVDQLVHDDWLPVSQKIETAVALMQLIRVSGLATSFNRWMETTGYLTLDQGRLDEPNHWRFPWQNDSKISQELFRAEGLNKWERNSLIEGIQVNIAATNKALSRIGRSEANTIGNPLMLIHGDVNTGLVGFLRWGKCQPYPVLILLNLSPVTAGHANQYEINIPVQYWHGVPSQVHSVCKPLLGKNQDILVLTQQQSSATCYQINRPLYAFESALFELTDNDL